MYYFDKTGFIFIYSIICLKTGMKGLNVDITFSSSYFFMHTCLHTHARAHMHAHTHIHKQTKTTPNITVEFILVSKTKATRSCHTEAENNLKLTPIACYSHIILYSFQEPYSFYRNIKKIQCRSRNVHAFILPAHKQN